MKLMHGVKWIEGEFHLRCASCWTKHQPCYWPMSLDFWDPKQGLTRCRACWATYRRTRPRERSLEMRRKEYQDNREVILYKKRAHYAENRDRILERKRELHAARKAA